MFKLKDSIKAVSQLPKKAANVFQHYLVICSPKRQEAAKSLPLIDLKEESFIKLKGL